MENKKQEMNKQRILFVCLGNICRSPSAEAVFTGLVKKAGLLDKIEIDSAGTSGFHAGEPADKRMQTHAIKRGYNLTSLSRPVDKANDFDDFDMIIGMDDSNMDNLHQMAPTLESTEKLYKMTDFCSEFDYDHVPDPYYGGAEGFELVLDLLEDACNGLLTEVEKRLNP